MRSLSLLGLAEQETAAVLRRRVDCCEVEDLAGGEAVVDRRAVRDRRAVSRIGLRRQSFSTGRRRGCRGSRSAIRIIRLRAAQGGGDRRLTHAWTLMAYTTLMRAIILCQRPAHTACSCMPDLAATSGAAASGRLMRRRWHSYLLICASCICGLVGKFLTLSSCLYFVCKFVNLYMFRDQGRITL